MHNNISTEEDTYKQDWKKYLGFVFLAMLVIIGVLFLKGVNADCIPTNTGLEEISVTETFSNTIYNDTNDYATNYHNCITDLYGVNREGTTAYSTYISETTSHGMIIEGYRRPEEIPADPNVCWEAISCKDISTGNWYVFPNGMIIDEVDKALYTCIVPVLDVSNIGLQQGVKITVVQGGFLGNNRNQDNPSYIIRQGSPYNNDIPLVFNYGKAQSPVIVYCHSLDRFDYTYSNTNQEAYLLDQYMLSYSMLRSVDAKVSVNTMPTINANNTLSGSFSGTIRILSTVTRTFTNLKADPTNWFFYGIALFFLVIGLLLIFTAVIGYTKKGNKV